MAHYRGPVILAWAEVLADGRNPGRGRNLVFHEFAHQLDMLDGYINGTPLLETAEQYQRWHDVMTKEFNRFLRVTERGRETVLDEYGAEDEAEFFAVVTECFFDRPRALLYEYPRLYSLFRDYYRQDPAKRSGEWRMESGE